MNKALKILFLAIAVALVFGSIYWLWKKSQPEEVLYEIVTVDTGDVENTSVATGKISPRDEILIKPQISGIISVVLKKAGEFIKAGEIIAVVQVIPEMSQLNSAESRVRLAKIEMDRIKVDYERQMILFGKGVISGEDMEKSEADFQKAREEIVTSQDNLDIVKNGISKATASISNTQIRSTISGTILDIPVKAGNSVIQANTFNDGTTIASVANMKDLIFIGKVDETEVGRIHVGMPLKLSVGAIENQKFDAELEYVAPKGTEENGAVLFEIKAAVTIPDSIRIRAGYSANAEIVMSKASSILTIPESSITFSNDSAYVHVLNDQNDDKKQIFEKKFIKIGLSDGVKVEVKSGLKKGDKIRGNEILKTPNNNGKKN